MDITITVTNTQATRIAKAVGNRFSLGRDATAQEVKQFMINHLKQTVIDQERQDALNNAVIETF